MVGRVEIINDDGEETTESAGGVTGTSRDILWRTRTVSITGDGFVSVSQQRTVVGVVGL